LNYTLNADIKAKMSQLFKENDCEKAAFVSVAASRLYFLEAGERLTVALYFSGKRGSWQ
jgi:hypothetical protein